MRKMMTKEVTSTTVKLAKMEFNEGVPVATQLPDEVILGNVTLERAQKELGKKYEGAVTVFSVEPNTKVYELPVEVFLQYASEKIADSEDETEVQEQA